MFGKHNCGKCFFEDISISNTGFPLKLLNCGKVSGKNAFRKLFLLCIVKVDLSHVMFVTDFLVKIYFHLNKRLSTRYSNVSFRFKRKKNMYVFKYLLQDLHSEVLGDHLPSFTVGRSLMKNI